MIFEDFVKQFSLEDWIKVILDSEVLYKEGVTGDCKMREITDTWCKISGLLHCDAMRSIMQEAYRQVALQYIKNQGLGAV